MFFHIAEMALGMEGAWIGAVERNLSKISPADRELYRKAKARKALSASEMDRLKALKTQFSS